MYLKAQFPQTQVLSEQVSVPQKQKTYPGS